MDMAMLCGRYEWYTINELAISIRPERDMVTYVIMILFSPCLILLR